MIVVAAIVAAVLLVLASLLRAGGASLGRTHRADALHDAAEGDPRATRVAMLLAQRPRLAPSIGIVTSALVAGSATLGTWAVVATLEGTALAAGLVGVWVAILVLGDLVPRSYGRERPGELAYRLAGMLGMAVRLGSATDELVSDDEEDDEEGNEASEAGDEEREREEREMISSVLEFSDTLVREVMTPRTDLVTIPMTATSDDALDVFVETGFSRIPITGEDADDIVGTVFARDFLRLTDEGRSAVPITEFMRPASFVPETKRVSDLLKTMQADKTHMAIVVDEYGGTAGLATIEDLLEELVGEIVDEFDDEEELVEHQDDGALVVNARLPVEDLAERLDVELPDEEWDTVGGLVLGLAGRVPRVGERFEVAGHEFTALRVQGRRIEQVRVTQVPLAGEDA